MVKIDIEQLRKAIKALPMNEKVRLAEELQKETRSAQLKSLLKRIDQRRKKYKISAKEISETIDQARKEFHASRR